MNKKEQMYQEIEKHGENLNRIFKTSKGNIALCKSLRRLEAKAHKLATDYCNGENGVNSDNWEALTTPILKKVCKLLNVKPSVNMCPDDSYPIKLNGDARGYALKIEDSYVREHCLKIYRDMGGYGILAPDLS